MNFPSPFFLSKHTSRRVEGESQVIEKRTVDRLGLAANHRLRSNQLEDPMTATD